MSRSAAQGAARARGRAIARMGRMERLVAERQAAAEARARLAGTAPGGSADGGAREDMLLDAIEEARFASGGEGGGAGSGAGVLAVSGHAFTVALFALFVVALLLAILAGTGVYRALRAADGAASDERLSTSLIANAVRATDAAGSVSAAEGPEGPALVLTEHLDSGDYQTRFYLYRGFVVQEYALADAPLAPDAATPVVESASFSFELDEGSELLRVSTDAGEVLVALRSAGGDAR